MFWSVFEVDFIAALNIVSGIAVGFYLKRRRILNLLRARRRQVAQVFISRVVDLVLRRRVKPFSKCVRICAGLKRSSKPTFCW